jgi:hypothetical protein
VLEALDRQPELLELLLQRPAHRRGGLEIEMRGEIHRAGLADRGLSDEVELATALQGARRPTEEVLVMVAEPARIVVLESDRHVERERRPLGLVEDVALDVGLDLELRPDLLVAAAAQQRA